MSALTAAFGACQPPPGPAIDADIPEDNVAGACSGDAYLSTALYGSIQREIRWSADELSCESMLRPEGKGVRLRFTGAAAGSQLAFILAMPELARGATVVESPTVVTLSVEGSGRFFSTPTAQSCWSDIAAQKPVAGNANQYTIDGTVYCVAPLGEINGDAAVSIPEMTFRGIVDWSAT